MLQCRPFYSAKAKRILAIGLPIILVFCITLDAWALFVAMVSGGFTIGAFEGMPKKARTGRALQINYVTALICYWAWIVFLISFVTLSVLDQPSSVWWSIRAAILSLVVGVSYLCIRQPIARQVFCKYRKHAVGWGIFWSMVSASVTILREGGLSTLLIDSVFVGFAIGMLLILMSQFLAGPRMEAKSDAGKPVNGNS